MAREDPCEYECSCVTIGLAAIHGLRSTTASQYPTIAGMSSEAGQAGKDKRFKNRDKRAHEVVFHTYPKLLFIWPIIAAGLVLYPVDAWGWIGPEVLGWMYVLLLATVVITIGIDLERNHAVFWLIAFLFVFFLGRWLSDAKGFTLFGDIYNGFASLDVNYNRSLGLALSILLALPYGAMLIWARLQHRWRITHNEFEHYSWGRADDSLARGAKRVRSTYPDLLELLICGAGTLIVFSATGRSELRRIPNVPLIFLVRRRINRLLEYTAVTTGEEQALLDEESELDEDAEAATRDMGDDRSVSDAEAAPPDRQPL